MPTLTQKIPIFLFVIVFFRGIFITLNIFATDGNNKKTPAACTYGTPTAELTEVLHIYCRAFSSPRILFFFWVLNSENVIETCKEFKNDVKMFRQFFFSWAGNNNRGSSSSVTTITTGMPQFSNIPFKYFVDKFHLNCCYVTFKRQKDIIFSFSCNFHTPGFFKESSRRLKKLCFYSIFVEDN